MTPKPSYMIFFCALPKSMIYSSLLRPLRKTHSHLHADACDPESAFITKAIQSLCRVGDIQRARKLFDEMPGKNVSFFSVMIYGYASNGFFSQSFLLYSQMQQSEIRPNSYTFVAVLLGTASLRDLEYGECIHGRIIKSGYESDSFVMTALLNSYSKCGAASDAFRLFSEIKMPSVASWNAMISGFVHNCLFEEAILLFERLQISGIMPNCFTMMSVTQICSACGSPRLCENIHGYVVKAGFESDVSLMNSVLDMYLSFGRIDIARDFFMKMDSKDVITWTNMMCCMLELECPSEALLLFSQMRGCAIDADIVAMVNVITACARLGDLVKAMPVHGQIVTHGFGSELPVMNSLITMYSRCGAPGFARMSFDQIFHKSLVSWTAMMFGYAWNGLPREGLYLFNRVRREEPFNLDSVTLVCSLVSSGELASLELCKQLHSYSCKSGLILCCEVQNCLVAAYGRCGYSDLARRLFKEMVHRDVVSWNAMISAYGINGEGEEALSLFQAMENCGEKPDSITFVNVLNACSHCGMVDVGLLVFEKMLHEKRITPRAEHCGCLVDMLARASRLDEARKLADSMPEEVALSVWKALLGRYHGNTDSRVAEVAAARVFEITPGDASHVVLLSNVYASLGRFDNVESLRTKIGKKGLVKSLGFSMVDYVPSMVG